MVTWAHWRVSSGPGPGASSRRPSPDTADTARPSPPGSSASRIWETGFGLTPYNNHVAPVEEVELCRGEEERAHPGAADTDAHGQGLPLVEMLGHSHDSRDVHQAWAAVTLFQ